MKVRDTSPGRLYALSSEIGCTAINGAMAADIPAGGQVVILALDKKIVIDGDDAAKFVEVRWGTNTVVGSRPAPAWLSAVLSGLISIVGDANFDINYIPAENKLYLQFSFEVTTEQIAEVQTLLDRELPKNIVTEIDPFPIDFTKVEYLQSTKTQYINTGWVPKDNNNAVYEVAFEFTNDFTTSRFFGYDNNYSQPTECLVYLTKPNTESDKPIYIYIYCGLNSGNWNAYFTDPGEVLHFRVGKGATYVNDVKLSRTPNLTNAGNLFIYLFGAYIRKSNGDYEVQAGSVVRIPYFNATDDLTEIRMVPALDNTGAPCMFDTVTRTAFYNAGTGDFLYPGAEQAVMTLDLDWDAKSYAKLTEHGIRRLYHVPKGYTGTMDDYAAENGFKELVEPPAPLEGYWIPQWRETDTQLICDWVETEPPTEEDTENA